MSFDGYHVGGMSIKTWAYSTLLVGFHLSLGVCEAKCIQGSFKNHVTDNLLMDYLYRIKNFQHPFEQTKPEYTALSIFNMLCLSWLENKDYYDTGNNESSEDSETKEESREKLMHSYRIILSLYLGNETRNRSTVEQHCRKHACNFSYSTKDLSPKDLQSMYYETCHWNGTFPACPSPQDTSSSTVQASTVTTTPVTAYQSTTVPSSTTSHQSINPSTPTSSSTTSYQSISASASPFQVSQMTDSPVPNDPMTSTPFSTTNHQSISASASTSQLSHMTDRTVSNDPSTPSPSSTTNYETINNGKTCPRMGEVEALKSKNLVFTFLFIVSGLANVVLMIIVWSQCRGRRQYPQERTEVPRPGDLAELVILNGNVDLQ
ncbi:putative protein TPRXL isoform X2 [Colossoma macropomum]|uniref:putative protein TPRXL isoform X2 n=1 Tax=Colossoma macropomum TaxID=42526 RepID=UPI00186516C9|nr:putative protein TPRXL isoform X2 [Colossoma macropomum]